MDRRKNDRSLTSTKQGFFWIPKFLFEQKIRDATDPKKKHVPVEYHQEKHCNRAGSTRKHQNPDVTWSFSNIQSYKYSSEI